MKKSKRKIVVLTSLAALLSTLSALLLALAPPPLSSDAYSEILSATNQDQFLGAVFKTAVPTRTDQWKYIYVHHSATAGGEVDTLTAPGAALCDHFVIGNGNGYPDGEIEMGQRWNQQQPPGTPPGVDHIDPGCVSICLVGDFDHSMPTPMQLRRLTQLVATLQSQLRIGSDNVILLNGSGTPSSVGRYFPVTAFRQQLLP